MLVRRIAGAAAVLVALALLPACGRTVGPAGPRPPGDSPDGNASPVSVISNKAQARHRLHQVIADVPVLPGSRAVRRPPDAALERPMQTIGSPNFLEVTHWWTAPGTVGAALKYLRQHPPRGLRVTGHGTGSSPDGVVESLIYDGHPTDAYNQLTLIVSVTGRGAGVAVRADAEVVWLPRRSAAEHLDKTLTSVDVAVTRPGVAPTVHRTLTGHRVRMLADVVNHLPVQPPGAFSCPADLGYRDTLVFHGHGPDVVLRADVTGCGFVEVTVAGHRQPGLQGGLAVDRAVARTLGLPDPDR